MTQDDTLLHVARTIAAETGQLIIEGRSQTEIQSTKSSAADIVTHMDLAAEKHLRERLAHLRPDDGILGEEGDDVVGTSGITWILDPIDGTVNYLYGLPHFAVSVAAVSGPARAHEWTHEVGAVFDGSGVLWSAERGKGATRNDVALARHEGPDLSGTLLATGFQYIASRREAQGKLVAQLLPQVRDIRRLGAAAVDLCLVAAGHVDAYYEQGLNAWDFAAAALIASEAGIKVAGIDGGPADERLTIAAVPGTWNSLHDALIEAGARLPWDA